MKKDVIYIDTEDDITSIIDRVKNAKADIVALVPPKRIGVLQSIVNLKLLKKAAGSADKRVVLITNDRSLASLAGGVHIPTAKNLQSRPEIAQIAALEVDNNEVINGEELPIGEVNDAMGEPSAAKKPAEPAPTPLNKAVPLQRNGKKMLKVPDFMKFRKKLFIIGGALLALILLLWWMYGLAPRLTVTITAKTTIANISRGLTLDPAAETNVDENIVKTSLQQLKKTNTVEFDATGKKDVGDKATGTLTLTNDAESSPISVPAGTPFTAGSGHRFVTSQAATVPGAYISGGQIIAGTATVAIVAADIGPEFNVGPQSFANSAGVKAATQQATAGGSKKTVTVVSDADVEKAKQQLGAQNATTAKDELARQFKKETYKVINESFKTDAGSPTSAPAVGQEAGRAKLTMETTYSLTAMNRRDLGDILDTAVSEQIRNENEEQIYDNGATDVKFSNFQMLEGGKASVTMKTTGYIGAKVNQTELKEQMVGKRYGDIEAILSRIPNVEKTKIELSPFWVTNAPPVDKITVIFNATKK